MASATESANLIFDKLQNADANRRIAVFVKGSGDVLMVGPATGSFNEAMKKIPHGLVGVYDRDATLKQIEGDLAFMGMTN